MKTSILSILAMLSLSAVFGPVHLMAQDAIHVTIPFNFTVGAKPFVAGEYTVKQVTPAILAIQSADGRAQMAIIGQPGEPSDTPGVAKLTFHRYGDRYFLSRVAEDDKGWELRKSTAEKELLAKRAQPTTLSIIASVASVASVASNTK